jgi:pyridinium-3,5-biscarboxylic acid mononucleotide sulfurtransferase
MSLCAQFRQLREILAALGPTAVAVSGGVDSTTLASLTHRTIGRRATMVHAVSPAVPHEATARLRSLAAREGWWLEVLDAGEFADERYLANPVNRCFFCKANLYGAIRRRSGAQILSGTNLDDLGEYRPGLDAAREHGVRHPYVEAGIDKKRVRAIARRIGLGEIAELPAAPCLASRVETGIPIVGSTLALVHEAELLVGRLLRPQTVRCRVRRTGIVVELDGASLRRLDGLAEERLRAALGTLLEEQAAPAVTIAFEAYRTGSAFLRPAP